MKGNHRGLFISYYIPISPISHLKKVQLKVIIFNVKTPFFTCCFQTGRHGFLFDYPN